MRCLLQDRLPFLSEQQKAAFSVKCCNDRLCPVAVKMSQQDDDWLKKQKPRHLPGGICFHSVYIKTP